ncbi:DUF1822 family protein [Iningainema tapete]|uniref:DUF1822 family protein n=1 Tax=Iningainema tapete BLCC-T55 TaxID=2748662 RepID=A0A8J6XHM2_9CYAN|nr:DUF1822 family protein [Iningainema tapete]MBD2776079.1 DUF1822 family protein [Iningainema tapete BLCC-T55]
MSNITTLFTFTGPLLREARKLAEQWSKQQAAPEKGEQVRLNILSVSFVNSYLEYMDFDTELEASDSWNPLQQTLMDVADLQIKNLGKLECRPVLAETQFIYVPPEVQSNRIGYVAVQISESFREATLLGFVKQASSDLIPISQLQPVEDLLEHLEYLAHVETRNLETRNFASLQKTPSKNLVNLKQWLENIFEVGWLEIETFFDMQEANPALSLRSATEAFVRRGKLIELGTELTVQTVLLVVEVRPKNQQEMDIVVEAHPPSGKTYLPHNLLVMVLDEEGISVMQAIARRTNENMQLHFSGEEGERFSVKLVMGDVSVVENFII